jgi:hypothetical protein
MQALGMMNRQSWCRVYSIARRAAASYVGNALLPADVCGPVGSEGAVIDSLHQAQASGSRQARTRDHVLFIAFPKEIPPRSLASELSLQRTTNGLGEVYIERLRCNETLRRIVCALSLERYGRKNTPSC